MNKKEEKLHNIAASYILGESINKKIKGKSYVVDSFISLLEVSKKLYNALQEEKSLEEISRLLDEKRDKTIDFKKKSGFDWRL